MPAPDDGHFRLTAPDGSIIARGSLSALMERVNQSVPRMSAEQAIAAAAKAIHREADDKVRADALQERELAVKAREDAIFADNVRKFVDGVAEVARRLVSLEQKRNQAILDNLPDPDACADFLPQAPIEPSADKDREMLEAQEAIEKNDGELELRHHTDQGDLPAELLKGAPAQSGNYPTLENQPYEGQVPQMPFVSLNKADSGYVCRRDAKAARKRLRQLQGLQA
jgi:hypothetical protein